MFRGFISSFAGFAILVTIVATPALAGVNIQTDWTAVQALPRGTKVRVETKDKKTYLGTIDTVTDTGAMIAIDGGQTQQVSRDNTRRVYRFEAGKSSRGKAIGIWAAIGAGVGAGIGAAVLGATGGSDETGKVLAPFILGGAGAGAAIGAAMGQGEKKILIYEDK